MQAHRGPFVPPQVQEQRFFRAGEGGEPGHEQPLARQQRGQGEAVGAFGGAAGFTGSRQQPHGAEGVEAGRGPAALRQRCRVRLVDAAQRSQQGGGKGGHLPFHVLVVFRHAVLDEEFLHQRGKAHAPRKEPALVRGGEVFVQFVAGAGQTAHAVHEQAHPVQQGDGPGRARGRVFRMGAQQGEHLAHREHAGQQAGPGDVRGAADAVHQIAAGPPVRKDEHGVAGADAGGLDERGGEPGQEVRVPRKDQERARPGDAVRGAGRGARGNAAGGPASGPGGGRRAGHEDVVWTGHGRCPSGVVPAGVVPADVVPGSGAAGSSTGRTTRPSRYTSTPRTPPGPRPAASASRPR